MTPEAVVRWALVVAVVLVALAIVVVLLQAWRELRRILRRAGGYGQLPAVRALARAEADLARIEAAVDAVDPLLARARRALATIRRGPQFSGVLGRIIDELGAFLIAARR